MWGTILIIYLIDGVIFGLITKYVSESKGYEGGFAWGFFLGLIGLLVVGFRPNIVTRTRDEKPIYSKPVTVNKSEDEGTWLCGCGAKNRKEALFCKDCGKRRILKAGWNCSSCGKKNDDDAKFCVFCGEDRKTQSEKSDSTPQKTESNKAYKIQNSIERVGKTQIKCSECGELQDSNRSICWKCGREFVGYQGENETTDSITNMKGWTCPKCKRANTGEQLSCVECGYQREA